MSVLEGNLDGENVVSVDDLDDLENQTLGSNFDNSVRLTPELREKNNQTNTYKNNNQTQ